MTQKQTFSAAFAPAIWDLVKKYQDASDDNHLNKKLLEAIKQCLYKWSDRYPDMISEEVKKLADEKGVDPFKLLWPDRKIFNKPGDLKSRIVFEHTTPLGELLSNLSKCKSVVEIENNLNEYSGVAWITREEDNKLNENKLRSNRPGGWKKCYEDWQIKIVYKKSS